MSSHSSHTRVRIEPMHISRLSDIQDPYFHKALTKISSSTLKRRRNKDSKPPIEFLRDSKARTNRRVKFSARRQTGISSPVDRSALLVGSNVYGTIDLSNDRSIESRSREELDEMRTDTSDEIARLKFSQTAETRRCANAEPCLPTSWIPSSNKLYRAGSRARESLPESPSLFLLFPP